MIILALVVLLAALATVFFAKSTSKRKAADRSPIPAKAEQTAKVAAPTLVSTAPPATDPLSSGPLVKGAPASSQWVVTYKYPDENTSQQGQPAAGGTRVKKIVATRSGPVTYEEITDESGGKIEKWYSNNEQFTRKPGSPGFFSADKNGFNNANYEYRSPTGFQGFDWIAKSCFEGIKKIDGRDCLVFRSQKRREFVLDPNLFGAMKKMQADAPNSQGPSEPTVAVTASIDLETRLPISVQIGEEIRTFTFLEPPKTPVTLPPELSEQIEKKKKAWDDLTRPAPRPY